MTAFGEGHVTDTMAPGNTPPLPANSYPHFWPSLPLVVLLCFATYIATVHRPFCYE